MKAGLDGADVVMMLRLQQERMTRRSCPLGARVSSASSAWTARSWPFASRTRMVMHPAR